MGVSADVDRTDLGSLALRSFRIFGAHWKPLMRAYSAPAALAFVAWGVAFLVISTINEAQRPRPANHLYWNVADLIIAVLIQPLVLTSLLLALAVAAGEDVPHAPTFSSAVNLWPSQVQIVLAFFGPAVGVWWVAAWVWKTMVAVPHAGAFAQGTGVVLTTGCLVGAAALAFLGTLAAIPVALRGERPATAIVAAFDGLFLRNVFAGLSAAVLFGVLLAGVPVFADWAIAIVAVSTHVLPITFIIIFVPFVFAAIAVAFAFLYSANEVAAA